MNLPDTATISDLLAEIRTQTFIISFDVKYGYPPIPLPLAELDQTFLLKDLGINLDGEQLTIMAREEPQREAPTVEFIEHVKTQKPISLAKRMKDSAMEMPLKDRGSFLGMHDYLRLSMFQPADVPHLSPPRNARRQ